MSHGGKSITELPPIATLLTPEERLRVDAAGEGCYRTLHRESVDDVIRDLKAQQVRTLINGDYEAAFERVELVAMPTSPTGAFPIGERTADPVQMYLADVFTVGANLAGLPAISVPCGFTAEGLPVGLQLTARRMDEPTALRAAAVYEQITSWNKEIPELAKQ